MSFKDGRIGVGKDPIFPLDISGSCRIDGDLILGGRFSDSQGNPIQLGSGSGASSTPDQTSSSLPSWQGGTITTQGLGVFKGVQDPVKKSLYINGDSAFNMGNTTGSYNTTVGYEAGVAITGGGGNVIVGRNAGRYINNGANNVMVGNYAGHAYNSTENVFIGKFSGYANSKSHNVSIGCDTMQQAYPTEYSVAIGYMAGYGAGGENQIYIGREAGKSTSAYNNQTGDDNIGIGAYALNKVTSGRNNVCIGLKSGETIGTGQYNTCIGSEGGINITSAESNTTVGAYCAPNITTGNYNTIMGVNAGYNITTGTNNVCIGMQSGFSRNFSKCVLLGFDAMCYGTSNVQGTIAIGFQAGYREGSGNRNIYIGQQTGPQGTYSSRTCAENVVIGYQCGYYLTTGNYNTLIGRSAGHQINSGDYNICLGYYAAIQATDTNDSIIIGRNAGYSLQTASDTIAIGQSALAKITTSANSIGIGRYAGHGITGGQNICIGYHVAYNSTGNTGHNNVFIGQIVGYDLTSGYENVSIGRESARKLTTALRCVFIGSYAGFNNTTSNNQICIGYRAGYDCVTGTANTFVGAYAGEKTTSSNNTFVGSEAGRNNTSSQNTFVGKGCGYANTSGFDNTAVGHYSLYANTSGYGNNAMGYYSLSQNTTGDYNVAIGVNAAAYNSSGNYNVAIGLNANQYVQTRHYNIAIGAYAMAGNSTSATSADHQLYINSHNGYYGQSSFIYGHMKMDDKPWLKFNNNLLIGAYNGSPMAPLHIEAMTDNNVGGDCAFLIRKNYNDWGITINCANSGGSFGYGDYGIDINGTGSYALRIKKANSEKFRVDFDGKVYFQEYIQMRMDTSPQTWHKFADFGNNVYSGGFLALYDKRGGANSPFSDGAYFGLGTRKIDGSWNTTQYLTIRLYNYTAYSNSWSSLSQTTISDRRIKKDIEDVPDHYALQKVRDLPCRYYNYKDNERNEPHKVIGFIAQEVQEHLPGCVAQLEMPHIIPNIQQFVTNVKWEKIGINANDPSKNDFKITCDTFENYKKTRYRLYLNNNMSNRHEDSLMRECLIQEDNSFIIDDISEPYDYVYVYGEEIDDMIAIKKDQIFALHHSAIQELDKKVIALENENAELKARLAKLEAFLGI